MRLAITDDTYISSTATTTNFATSTTLLAGQHWDIVTPNFTRITLMRLDFRFLTSPPDSCILRMFEETGTSYGSNESFSWHRCLRTYGFTTTTWNLWDTGQSWSSGAQGLDGTDFESAIAASASLTYNGAQWREFDFTSFARTYYGQLVAVGGAFDTTTTGSNSIIFTSSRGATVANRPHMLVRGGVHPYHETVFRDGPVLYLPLNDSSGTAARAIAGASGTYTGSVVLGAVGPTPVGSTGFTVNADNEYVTTSLTSLTSPWTIECWFKFAGTTLGHDFYALLDKTSYYATGADDFPLRMVVSNTGVLRAQYGDASGFDTDLTLNSTTSVNDAAWHHGVVTYTAAGTCRLYLDGVQEASGTGPTLPVGSRSWTIGRAAAEAGGGVNLTNFDGSIAAAAIYDYELSADQVLQHYRAAPPAFKNLATSTLPSGVILHLPLDDFGGTIAYADVGFNHTIVNAPTFRSAGPSTAIPYGMTFDAVNENVRYDGSLPGFPVGASAGTVEAWVYRTTSGALGGYGSSFNSGTQRVYQIGGAGEPAFTDGVNVPNNHNWTTGITASTWSHVAFSYNGSVMSFYVNGVLDSTKTFTLDTTAVTGSTARSTIGVRPDDGRATAYFGGRIAGYTVYNRALTAAEIYERYALGANVRAGVATAPVRY